MRSITSIVLLALAAGAHADVSRDDKIGWARQMVTNSDWGILGTTSTMSGLEGTPFGNPNSIAEVDGKVYFYVSGLDQSMIDVERDNHVSLALSDAQDVSSSECAATAAGDPESPMCSRLTMSGTFNNISGTDEADVAWAAISAKHPTMANWPSDHGFFVGKLEISHLWLINFYGGATNLTPEEYYGYAPTTPKSNAKPNEPPAAPQPAKTKTDSKTKNTVPIADAGVDGCCYTGSPFHECPCMKQAQADKIKCGTDGTMWVPTSQAATYKVFCADKAQPPTKELAQEAAQVKGNLRG